MAEKEVLMGHSGMNKIDMISVDRSSGQVLLHLIMEGPWNDVGDRMEWLHRRLNIYGAFVVTGQLAESEAYRGLAPKVLLHCEVDPPPEVLAVIAKMRQYLLAQSIELAVTIGHDLTTEIPLSAP
jgi:hypothetical protein